MTADFKMALLELLRKHQGEPEADALREGLRWLAQKLMELEVSELVGAERYERTETRKTYRNGYRVRPWETRLGSIELKIPKLRKGSYFPSLLERRRRAEKALVAVIQEAYVHGVSTRKVDELVRALGLDGVSKREVSRLCAELDERMERFRNRPLEGEYPYLWLDAKAIKVRQDGRVVNMAAVVAVGVKASGEREVLGSDVGAAETYEFSQAFLRSLVARGLRGVRLAISDAHEGLKRAIADVLTGASWQRCRVHFMRNLLARVPKYAQPAVAAQVRSIFAQPDAVTARQRLQQVADELGARYPKVAALLHEAENDVLAYMAFPAEHWRRIHSTNVLERLNRELARRCDVVGIFPNVAAALRLLGAVLEEQHDEWIASRKDFSPASMAKLAPADPSTERDNLEEVVRGS
ncbi:IS256 family transposase [Thermaerobacter subterraneus]|uniref:Mutator family transposase n=1 Tax=Thermaerobacter subterraneus DSM 13965 TaxID=867903 RepID=K6Q2T6_9FIRM|nr:IS256 family transposase [Thermaerobacter subterraneus]EKP95364.1 transposase [Thermaerobacter subterraneus DSM 13965]